MITSKLLPKIGRPRPPDWLELSMPTERRLAAGAHFVVPFHVFEYTPDAGIGGFGRLRLAFVSQEPTRSKDNKK
jgi:hypothetical protein